MVAGTEVLPEKFSTKYRSVNVFGRVELLTDPAEKKHGLIQLLKKYSAAHEEAGLRYIDAALDKVHVLKLPIETLTGKARMH